MDGLSNVALTNRIAHFELGQIPESARELKAVLGTLVAHYVRQHVLGLPRTVKKLLVLEELARFLDLPDTDAFVRELYSQMRKANVVVVSILQLIQQLADPKLRAAVLGNTSSYLIFNPGDRGDLALLAQEIGLSNAAQEAILKYRKPAMIPGQKFSEFMFFHNDPARPLCGTVRHFLPEAGEKSSASSPQPSNHPHIA